MNLDKEYREMLNQVRLVRVELLTGGEVKLCSFIEQVSALSPGDQITFLVPKEITLEFSSTLT